MLGLVHALALAAPLEKAGSGSGKLQAAGKAAHPEEMGQEAAAALYPKPAGDVALKSDAGSAYCYKVKCKLTTPPIHPISTAPFLSPPKAVPDTNRSPPNWSRR